MAGIQRAMPLIWMTASDGKLELVQPYHSHIELYPFIVPQYARDSHINFPNILATCPISWRIDT